MTAEVQHRRNETPMALELFNSSGAPIPVEGELYAPAWQVAVGYALEIDGVRRAILDVRQVSDTRAQVTLGQVIEHPGRPRLRFVIGPRPGVASNFSIMHGDRDLSELFDVQRLRMEIDTKTRSTVVAVDLLAAIDTFAGAEFTREGVPAGSLEALVRTLAEQRHVLEMEPDNMEGLSRRHLVQIARAHRAAVIAARNLLASTAAEACATCGLPEEAHPAEGHSKTDHAFVLAVKTFEGRSRILLFELDSHGNRTRMLAEVEGFPADIGEALILDGVRYVISRITRPSLIEMQERGAQVQVDLRRQGQIEGRQVVALEERAESGEDLEC